MLDAGEFPTAYAGQMRITFDAQYLPAERTSASSAAA